MDDMFERLGWASTRPQNEDSGASSTNAPSNGGDGYGEAASAIFGFSNPNQDQGDNAEEEHTGIHGPGKWKHSNYFLCLHTCCRYFFVNVLSVNNLIGHPTFFNMCPSSPPR